MEIVSIERKTFEEMKERFGCFSQHVRALCARYRPPEKMNWMDGADVCEKLGISKRTLQTYRDRGLLPYSQINHKIYYRTEDVESFVEAMSREMTEASEMEVITRDTEEVRAYFEALEEGMRYLDTVTAHFRPAMNGEVYLTGEDVCRLLHITPRTLQDYRTQRLIPYISLPGKTLYRQSDLLRMLEENYVDMRPKRKRGKSPT